MVQILDRDLKKECFPFHQFNYFKIKGRFVFFRNKIVFFLYNLKLSSFLCKVGLWYRLHTDCVLGKGDRHSACSDPLILTAFINN